jgi:hypothetical protein
MNNGFLRLGTMLYGAPPNRDASRVDRMRWVRRLAIRAMLFYLPVLVVIGLGTSVEWLWLVAAACVLASVANIASLTFKIRREERVPRCRARTDTCSR